jgi:RHH-type proline utilization regulon transcriptional repressor/proline dehydrogenase/delta 1-pyrroline-5-carboxylate dehydrogenase
MEARIQELMVLLCRESGKTYANAIAEVREAVDFLRYYATQIENLPANTVIQPLGTVFVLAHGTSLLQFSQVKLLLH